MSVRSAGDPIVVGVDGSGIALDAVRWAAREAQRRGLPLRIVHACSVLALGRDWLREAAELAGDAGEKECALRIGNARQNLVAESARAAMLVVGWRGLGPGPHVALGSVAQYVAANSRCPVVVVRGRLGGRGQVLTGVHGAADAALAFAFDEADLHGTGVLALRASEGARPAARELTAELRDWRQKYPSVPVTPLLENGNPVARLVEHSGRARLLVLGGRALRAGTLGATSRALIRQASCPVVLVRGTGLPQ
ncbi:universal stress protein [Amycolatopsis acidicola]|uniref:Universal stress protein n=1 Tax=Amycolatopsis acidicola TaxID=2596893 RepID=A0A5N0USU8_9PSEU|nr:universal stress protein [Amycolatopsis acidicola]KAA9152165.1 universal stress protein [Amycolatopsis acidicola]